MNLSFSGGIVAQPTQKTPAKNVHFGNTLGDSLLVQKATVIKNSQETTKKIFQKIFLNKKFTIASDRNLSAKQFLQTLHTLLKEESTFNEEFLHSMGIKQADLLLGEKAGYTGFNPVIEMLGGSDAWRLTSKGKKLAEIPTILGILKKVLSLGTL